MDEEYVIFWNKQEQTAMDKINATLPTNIRKDLEKYPYRVIHVHGRMHCTIQLTGSISEYDDYSNLTTIKDRLLARKQDEHIRWYLEYVADLVNLDRAIHATIQSPGNILYITYHRKNLAKFGKKLIYDMC